jgi:hypothetical protein
MRTITIVTQDRLGLMADVTELLAASSINIESIEASKIDSTALLKIISDDADSAYQLLVDAGYHVVSQAGLLVRLKDEPGALARVSRTLAENSIDIRGVNIVDQHDGYELVAISCCDSEKAKTVLADIIV